MTHHFKWNNQFPKCKTHLYLSQQKIEWRKKCGNSTTLCRWC